VVDVFGDIEEILRGEGLPAPIPGETNSLVALEMVLRCLEKLRAERDALRAKVEARA